MASLSLTLRSTEGPVAARRCYLYPVWPASANRAGQGHLLSDGSYLGDPLIRMSDSEGRVDFENLSPSAEIDGQYVVSVESGPSWTNINLPEGDHALTPDLIGERP